MRLDLWNILDSFPIWFFPFVILCILAKFLKKRFRHLPRILKSYRRLNRLRTIVHPGQQFMYLRCVDPFIFEEMILTAFKQLDYKIIRNKKYTGDGGIDGKVFINGQMLLIQAKRYSKHINPNHVSAFVGICKAYHCQGLFIHTGKTGYKSYANSLNIVDIVSGKRMLDLLNKRCFNMIIVNGG